MTPRTFLISGILFMALGVMLGAFGAHALKQMFSIESLAIWKTATDYLFYHALGLIGLGIWGQGKTINGYFKISGILMLTGTVLFCGSLYLLVLTGNGKLGMITPIGGLSFIAAWIFWLAAVLKPRPEEEESL